MSPTYYIIRPKSEVSRSICSPWYIVTGCAVSLGRNHRCLGYAGALCAPIRTDHCGGDAVTAGVGLCPLVGYIPLTVPGANGPARGER